MSIKTLVFSAFAHSSVTERSKRHKMQPFVETNNNAHPGESATLSERCKLQNRNRLYLAYRNGN